MAGNKKPLIVGARGLRGTTLVLPAPCGAGLMRLTCTHVGMLDGYAVVLGSPEAANGASSGALYFGGSDVPACSMRCSEEHACWARRRRIFSGYGSLSPSLGPQTLLVLALLARAAAGNRHRPLRRNGEGGNRRDEHAVFPSLSSRGIHVPPEFAPFPAAMRVGCQAS